MALAIGLLHSKHDIPWIANLELGLNPSLSCTEHRGVTPLECESPLLISASSQSVGVPAVTSHESPAFRSPLLFCLHMRHTIRQRAASVRLADASASRPATHSRSARTSGCAAAARSLLAARIGVSTDRRWGPAGNYSESPRLLSLPVGGHAKDRLILPGTQAADHGRASRPSRCCQAAARVPLAAQWRNVGHLARLRQRCPVRANTTRCRCAMLRAAVSAGAAVPAAAVDDWARERHYAQHNLPIGPAVPSSGTSCVLCAQRLCLQGLQGVRDERHQLHQP